MGYTGLDLLLGTAVLWLFLHHDATTSSGVWPPSQAQSLTAAYLETALNKGIASPATYHLELAHIYLRLALHHDNTNAAGTSLHDN